MLPEIVALRALRRRLRAPLRQPVRSRGPGVAKERLGVCAAYPCGLENLAHEGQGLALDRGQGLEMGLLVRIRGV